MCLFSDYFFDQHGVESLLWSDSVYFWPSSTEQESQTWTQLNSNLQWAAENLKLDYLKTSIKRNWPLLHFSCIYLNSVGVCFFFFFLQNTFFKKKWHRDDLYFTETENVIYKYEANCQRSPSWRKAGMGIKLKGLNVQLKLSLLPPTSKRKRRAKGTPKDKSVLSANKSNNPSNHPWYLLLQDRAVISHAHTPMN